MENEKVKRYSQAFKQQVVREYEGRSSINTLRQKYGIGEPILLSGAISSMKHLIRLLSIFVCVIVMLGCGRTAAIPEPRDSPPTVAPSLVNTSTPTPVKTPVNPSLLIGFVADRQLGVWIDGENRILAEVDENSSLALSDDGQQIAFQQDGGLWIIDINGENRQELVSAEEIEALVSEKNMTNSLFHFDWVPGSKSILWNSQLRVADTVDSSSVVGPGFPLDALDDLHRVDIENQTKQTLATAGFGGQFYPSPNGEWIAVVSPRQIALLQNNHATIQKLLDIPEILTYSETAFYAQPHWTADSKSLLVEIPAKDRLAIDPEPNMLWQLWLDGREPVMLAQVDTFGMVLSPDLTRIGYTKRLSTAQPSNLEFHIAKVDGSEDQVIHLDTGGGFGEWLPDSKHFLFTADNGGSVYQGSLEGAPHVSISTLLSESNLLNRQWISTTELLYIAPGNGVTAQKLWLADLEKEGNPNKILIAESEGGYHWIQFDFVQFDR